MEPSASESSAPIRHADAMLMCQGTPVPARALTEPRPAIELSAEVRSVLEHPSVGIDQPLSEWLIAHESAERVVLMHELEEPLDLGGGDIRTYDLIAISSAAEHALPADPPWGVDRATSCTPMLDLSPLTEAAVALDPDALPEPGDDRIALLVTEQQCNSGQPATDRVELVELVETDTTVEVVIGVQPNEGGTCPSNPPTPFAVDLEQPLGDRAVLNAAVVPAREITVPSG